MILKIKLKGLFLIIVLVSQLNSCWDLDRLTMISTEKVTVSGNAITAYGTIIDLSEAEHNEYGFCYDINMQPTVFKNKINLGQISGPLKFTAEINDLAGNTTYYVRAYVKEGNSYIYGDIISAKVSVGKPEATIKEASEIGRHTAFLSGEVLNNGGSDLIDRGICLSTSELPTVNDIIIASATTLGKFSDTVKNLKVTTTYYARAYAYNSIGLIYSKTIKFTTLANWIKISTVPGVEKGSPTGFVIGDKLFVGTGSNGSFTEWYNDWWEFDLVTKKWSQKLNFPGGARSGSAGFSIKEKGYLGMGNNYTDFWKYDPKTDNWTKKDDFGDKCPLCTSFVLDNKGYIWRYDQLWQYDPNTERWTLINNKFPGRNGGSIFIISNLVYFGYGLGENNEETKDFWVWDPIQNSIKSISSLSSPDRGAISFSINGKGYVGSGSGNALIWEYDPKNDEWKNVASFPYIRWNPFGFTYKGKGYILLGGGQNSNEMWEFEP